METGPSRPDWRDPSQPDLTLYEDRLLTCLSFLMPFLVLGEDLREPALKAAHLHALTALNGGQPKAMTSLSGDPLEAASRFLAGAGDMLPEERKAATTRFIARAKKEDETDQKARALAAMLNLALAVCEDQVQLDPDDQFRILRFFQSATLQEAEDGPDDCENLKDFLDQSGGLQLEDPLGLLCFRLATHQVSARPRHRRRMPASNPNAASLAQAIYELLRN